MSPRTEEVVVGVGYHREAAKGKRCFAEKKEKRGEIIWLKGTDC
jgi:hypothetical protein